MPTSPPELASRRRILATLAGGAAGSLLGSQGLSNRLLAESAPLRRPAAKAKSLILIFNGGAPSHIDLWDPKPNAASNIRGSFAPISTAVPGLQISELIPRLAPLTDRLAVVRSVHHQQSSHNSGMYWSTVGRPYRIDSTLINPSPTDYPSLGTLLGWLAQRDGYQLPHPP